MRAALFLLTIALTGCGSAPRDPIESVLVQSDPDGAEAVLSCFGQTVDAGVTPVVLHGRQPIEACSVRITKDGYVPATAHIWPLALLLSGLFRVQVSGSPARAAGAMHAPDPAVLRVTLKPVS